MKNDQINELRTYEQTLKQLRDSSGNLEYRAEINNVLTPIVAMLDEYEHDRQPDFELVACEVLVATRKRICEMEERIPDTLRSNVVFPEEPQAPEEHCAPEDRFKL